MSLLAVLVVIQFFRPPMNSTKGQPEHSSTDLTTKYRLPMDVQMILETSCYDCHSNNTYYPWYWNIQPVAWWLNQHIKQGKKALNFNEFAAYPPRKQFHRMEDIEEQVKEDEMPLWSYTLVHTDARLSPGDKKILIDWSKAIRDTMKLIYPPDSLRKKAPNPAH